MSGVSINLVPFDALVQKLPPELHLHILECTADIVISDVVNKDIFSNGDMEKAGRTLVNLSLISKYCKKLFDIRLIDIKKIFDLYHKYRAFGEFDDPINPGTRLTPCGNTQLLDLLGTGNRRVKNSFMIFTEELAQDMEQIIKLMPRSITCNRGRLFEEPVTPLVIACYNKEIPIQSIELLLQKGANPNATLIWNGKRMHFLTFIKKLKCPAPYLIRPPEAKRSPTPSEVRDEQLKNVLEKYGAVEEEFNGEASSFFTGTIGSSGGGGFTGGGC